jgi:Transglycosylase SLT domain
LEFPKIFPINRHLKPCDCCLVTHIMKYFQIVLVLVMMALTTPLFYVQATKEITRSQNNKIIVEATTKSKIQSSINSSSEISITTIQLESSSTSFSSSSSEIISSSSENSSSSQIDSSSSVTKSIVKKQDKDDQKDELAAQILKSIEEKRIAEAKKEELTKKLLKQEEDRKAAEKKAAEEKRIAEEKAKEEERLKQEVKIAEEKRIEEEKKFIENKRIAEEKAKELAAERAKVSKSAVSSNSGSFSEAIDTQCSNFGCNPSQLKRIMWCESTGNPNAQNGIYTGLFQFHPQTFAANSRAAGLVNPDIYNGYDQIATAAYMFANGQARQWECK